jgi:hypothetical protein
MLNTVKVTPIIAKPLCALFKLCFTPWMNAGNPQDTPRISAI